MRLEPAMTTSPRHSQDTAEVKEAKARFGAAYADAEAGKVCVFVECSFLFLLRWGLST